MKDVSVAGYGSADEILGTYTQSSPLASAIRSQQRLAFRPIDGPNVRYL